MAKALLHGGIADGRELDIQPEDRVIDVSQAQSGDLKFRAFPQQKAKTSRNWYVFDHEADGVMHFRTASSRAIKR